MIATLLSAALLCAATPPPKSLAAVVKGEKAAALPGAAREALLRSGAVTVEGHEPHFFALYDRNAYEGLPSFVTLDVVLHLFHVRFDALLTSGERAQAMPLLKSFAHDQAEKARAMFPHADAPEPRLGLLASWHAVAALLLDPDYAPDPRIAAGVTAQVEAIKVGKGRATTPLCPRGLDYTRFKPRGHYATWELDRYFQATTFYSDCGFDLETAEGMARALDVLRLLDARSAPMAATLREFAGMLVGKPDDPGLDALRALVGSDALPPLPAPLPQILVTAASTRAKGMKKGDVAAQRTAGEPPRTVFRLLGAAGVPDAVLFSKTGGLPGRAFPSSLDLLAALGSADARGLLAADEKRLPQLTAALGEKLPPASGLYGRWLEILAAAMKPPTAPEPSFQRSDGWARHLTVAAAGSWAELRHDTLLYVKAPLVMMQGGHHSELPAAKAGGYVEPRPEIYDALQALLTDVTSRLPPAERDRSLVTELAELLTFLSKVARLELEGAAFPADADQRLRVIGTELEQLTRGHADRLPDQALIADVFDVAADEGAVRSLEVGIGQVDELWVIVPRGGKWLLTRGGAFSYYEFAGAPGERLDDREFAERVREGKTKRPPWATPLPGIPVKPRRKD